MTPTCETCRWWSAGFSAWSSMECPDGFGECRAKAPHGPFPFGTTSEDGKLVSAIVNSFPMVAQDDWCGEHQPKGNGDEQ